MSRRRVLAAAAVALLVAALAAVVVLAGDRGARGSTVSRGAAGWLGARRYLEARGARVTLVTEPLAAYEADLHALPPTGGERPGVLALVFPWQGPPQAGLRAAIEAHLGAGGDLLIAYSDEAEDAEKTLGLWHAGERARAPVNPRRWYAFVHREWDLRPAPSGSPARLPVRVWALRELPATGPGARVLYMSPAGRPAVAVFRHHGGRVVLLPADALSNARLAQSGNADLLETLLQNLGPRWAFDELDHGLVTASVASARLGRAADLLIAHLALLYLLAVAALARRPGPPWRQEAALGGSARGFLLGIGALHHRLGHHQDAARLLLRRVRELDRGVQLPAALDREAERAGPPELLAIARQVARRRAGAGAGGRHAMMRRERER